jgi:hypothetical protein
MSATLPPVAPEWPALAAVPEWLKREFGAGAVDAVMREIIHAVRAGELPYRIPVKPRLNRIHREQLPPGLGRPFLDFSTSHLIVVDDWDAAEADWQDGTVGGWEKRDGNRERVPITPSWAAIRTVAPKLLKREIAVVPSRKGIGGAPSRYDWWEFAREVVRLANTPDGLPNPPELLNHMRNWCLENWLKEPGDSTLRDYLSKLTPRTGT